MSRRKRKSSQLDLGIPDEERFLGFGERWARRRGYDRVLGVDEVGRGPLAGPVVAAAVVLPQDLERQLAVDGLDDSKKLSETARREFCQQIRAAAAFGIGEVDAQRVDEINILQASLEAMRIAIGDLLARSPDTSVDCILVDGNQPIVPTPIEGAFQKTLIQGDSRAVCIAAASVVAKVYRDALMVEFDGVYPGYGFASNKGYRSHVHGEGLDRLGPTPVHRRSFRGVVKDVPKDGTDSRPTVRGGRAARLL